MSADSVGGRSNELAENRWLEQCGQSPRQSPVQTLLAARMAKFGVKHMSTSSLSLPLLLLFAGCATLRADTASKRSSKRWNARKRKHWPKMGMRNFPMGLALVSICRPMPHHERVLAEAIRQDGSTTKRDHCGHHAKWFTSVRPTGWTPWSTLRISRRSLIGVHTRRSLLFAQNARR